MYGTTWEAAAKKYHISFMIANDAPSGSYGTVARFKSAGMASGYCFRVTDCKTDGSQTWVTVTNEGIAPLYRDAYFAVGDTRSETSLAGLLPGASKTIVIPTGITTGSQLHIVSPYILSSQQIQFNADVK